MNAGLYIISNSTGFERMKERCTHTDGPAWGKIHSLIREEGKKAGWATEDTQDYSPQNTGTSDYKYVLKKYDPTDINTDYKPTEWTDHKDAQRQSERTFKTWGFHRPTPPTRWGQTNNIYTDGSMDHESGKIGAGIWIEKTQQSIGLTFDEPHNVAIAELIALREATDWCAIRPEKEWHIFTDSEAILLGLKRFQKNPRTCLQNPYWTTFNHIQDTCKRHGHKIHYHKVRAHTGIKGNEEADEIAKQARDSMQTTQDTEADGDTIPPTTPAPPNANTRPTAPSYRHVKGVPEAAEGVAMFLSTPATDRTQHPTGWETKQIYQLKKLGKIIHAKHWYAGGKPSPWRHGHEALLDLPRQLRRMRSHKRWLTWMKLIHREFMTQSRAKLYTKNPNMSDKCPICNQEKDTWAHPVLRCKHPELQAKIISRHNKGLLQIVTKIACGKYGGEYLTADLKGWRYTDKPPLGELRNRKRDKHTQYIESTDEEEERNTPHEQFMEKILHEMFWGDSGDDSDKAYTPPSSEDEDIDTDASLTRSEASATASEEEWVKPYESTHNPRTSTANKESHCADSSSATSTHDTTEDEQDDSRTMETIRNGPEAAGDKQHSTPPAQTTHTHWPNDSNAPSEDELDRMLADTLEGEEGEMEKLLEDLGDLIEDEPHSDTEPTDTEYRHPDPIKTETTRTDIKAQKRWDGRSYSGLPPWLGQYMGKGRPDAILIRGVKWNERDKAPQASSKATIHIIEFTFTSEVSLPASRTQKEKQHEDLLRWLRTKALGNIKVKFHIIQMGVRGWMPKQAALELKKLGVPPKSIRALRVSLGRLAIETAINLIYARRIIEVQGHTRKQLGASSQSGYNEYIKQIKDIARAKRENLREKGARWNPKTGIG